MTAAISGLARFALRTDVRELPAPILQKAKACLLYGMAVGLAGMRTGQAAQAARAVAVGDDAIADREGANGKATRIFDGAKCDAAPAALANGTLFHARVQDDAHPAGHVGVVVIPAALAMAEATRASGADLLAAVVAGYESALRIGRDHAADLSARGFRTTPAYGVFGAAAAAGRLLRFDDGTMAYALGLAPNMAGGLREFAASGSEDFPFQAGTAAANGIIAARLAAASAGSSTSILEGEAGFYRAFGKDGRHYRARLAADVGKAFEIMGITWKPYPICQFHRGIVRGSLLLRERARGASLAALTIRMNPFEADFFGVRFSGPFTTFPQTFPQVTEYRQHTLVCGRCGHETRACLPQGVPVEQFGPRLLATVGLLTGAYHLSKRTAQEMLRDLFGVRLSLGALSGCEATVSDALAAPVTEAHEWVQESRSAHADETGWRERRRLAWLWVIATRLVTVFKVHARRNREAARALLGRFHGVLHSDRWAAYNIHTGLRQLCWAHLLRDFTAMSEASGRAAAIGRRLVRRAKKVLKRWHCVRDGTWSRKRFLRRTLYLRQKIEQDLALGARCGHAKTQHTCRRILKFSTALWTFVHKPDVEPTNNAAERAIRPAVLWRKRSFGTHSERGSRFAERMLTTFMTLKQQQRPVVDYVRQACQAFLQGQRVPSLVPISKYGA